MTLFCATHLAFEKRLIRVSLAVGLLACFAVLFFIPPVDLPLPVCLFQSITGHSCMTCGMTRSLHALAHGELAASAGYHLFGPVMFIAMLLCFAIFSAEAVTGRKSAVRVNRRIIVSLSILWLVYWSGRLVTECLS